jgi:hypothetical protein
MLDSEDIDCYASVMKSISQRLLMFIASANYFDVLTGDITNTYLYADCDVKVHKRAGQDSETAGYSSLPEGSLAKIVRELYGLPSGGRVWHVHLQKNLRKMRFKQKCFDPDVYMQSNNDDTGWDYLGVHTNDVTCVSSDAQGVMDELMKTYDIKKVAEPTYHLGCGYKKLAEDGMDYWNVGSNTLCREAINKFELLIGN